MKIFSYQIKGIMGLLLLFIPLSLDFLSDPLANTSAILGDVLLLQLILNAISVIGVIWIVTICTNRNHFSIPLEQAGMPLLIIWLYFILISVVSASANGIPVVLFGKIFYPFILAGVGVFVTNILIAKGITERAIVNIIVGASCISVIWTVIRVVVIDDVPLGGVRYRILGPGFPIVTAYIVSNLFVADVRRKFIPFLGLLMVIVLIAISQTRSILGAFILVIIITTLLVRNGRKTFVLFSLLSLFIIGIVMIFVPDFELPYVDGFIARIFSQKAGSGNNVDLTTMTRLAEYSSQIDELTKSVSRFLIGCGYGATYYYDFSYYEYLKGQVPEDVFHDGRTFLGHSLWMYSFFAGGLMSGWVIPFVLIRALLKGWKFLRYKRREDIGFRSPLQLTIFLSLFIYVILAFISHPFTHRFAALCIGSFIALSYMMKNSCFQCDTGNKRLTQYSGNKHAQSL